MSNTSQFARRRSNPLSVKSRLATSNSCTSKLHFVNSTRCPARTSSWAIAQQPCVLPLPGGPKSNTFS